VARKPNYGFEKRKKELDRQQRQEAKRQRKLEEAQRRSEEPAPDPAAAPDQPRPEE
jgi:hypothetical protein